MKLLSRLFVCTTTALALTVPLVFALWAAAGSDTSGLADSASTLMQEMERRDELSARDRDVLRCTQLKSEVIHQLLAGQLSLLQAAQEFGRLNDLLKQNGAATGSDPLPSAEEELCKSVLCWVSAESFETPAQRAVLARLQYDMVMLFPHRTRGQASHRQLMP